MALFGRRKDEDYETEEEFDEREKKNGRKITRKLKDLKPENKKKRKEPPKPWGSRERMMILIVILVTVLVSAALVFSSGAGSMIKFSKPKIDFSGINLNSLNIFREQTIIIEKK